MRGRVKCIYIDPPYNTGNEGWVYNDNVNDPKIKKWLGEVVGKEGEDLTRHDKWLCMMYPRLKLLQKLLTEDGVIFISIDDTEYANLKLICDEIFGSNCFVSNISWQRTYSTRNDSKGIVNEVEHLLVYSKQPDWNPNKLPRTAEMDERYKNPDNDVRPWKSSDAFAPDSVGHQGMVYGVQHPITGKIMYPPNGRHWSFGQEQVLEIMQGWAPYELRDINDAEVRAELCGIAKESVRQDVKAIMLSVPLEEAAKQAEQVYQRGQWPFSASLIMEKAAFGEKHILPRLEVDCLPTFEPLLKPGTLMKPRKKCWPFLTGKPLLIPPKPHRLIEFVLKIAGSDNALVLDSFAGSGTTAHAVLNMNKADGGHRKFILVEMMDYADSITAERVKRVIKATARAKRAWKVRAAISASTIWANRFWWAIA